MATFVKVLDHRTLPSSVEGGRGDGVVYEVRDGEAKLGYVAHIGFYSRTWTATSPLGSFLGEYDTRKEAAAGLAERHYSRELEQAKARLEEERRSRCAPEGTVEFWRFEIARLERVLGGL